MNQQLRSIFSGLVTAFVLPLTFAVAEELPHRKAGLWEIVATASGGIREIRLKQCVDEKTDAKLQDNGVSRIRQMGGTCSRDVLKKTSKGYEGEVECQIDKTTVSVKTATSGDFSSRYTSEGVTTYTPPLMGNSTTTVRMTAEWKGNCSDGLAPGDILMDDGTKFNVNNPGLISPK